MIRHISFIEWCKKNFDLYGKILGHKSNSCLDCRNTWSQKINFFNCSNCSYTSELESYYKKQCQIDEINFKNFHKSEYGLQK